MQIYDWLFSSIDMLESQKEKEEPLSIGSWDAKLN
jgi:hypothetical protein